MRYRILKKPDPSAGCSGPGWIFLVQSAEPGRLFSTIDRAEFYSLSSANQFLDMLLEGEKVEREVK